MKLADVLINLADVHIKSREHNYAISVVHAFEDFRDKINFFLNWFKIEKKNLPMLL
jgi:hypothetical protein